MNESDMDHNWREKTPTFFELGKYATRFVQSKGLCKIEDRERDTLLDTLSQILDTERGIYRKNRVFANVYCYLLLCKYRENDNDDILDEFHDCIGSVHHGNLITLQLLIEACKESELDKREELLEDLQHNCNDETKAVASAEIAFYLSRLDYRLYYPAIELLEASIPRIPEADQIFWKYELGQMYNKILNKDFWRTVDNLDLNKVFRRLYELLLEVCRSNDSPLSARAMVDLADAIEKCWTINECADMVVKIEVHEVTDWRPAKLRSRAQSINNHDPHVKERCARSLRKLECDQDTTKVDNLEDAIKTLKELTDKYRKRHVALHHLALSYRDLWLVINGLQQRQRPPKNKKKNKSRSMSHLSDVAESHAERHHFDVTKLRAYNPVKSDKTKRNELLEHAKDCLDRATKIMNDSCAIYLTDLAKIHMSLGDTKSACKCLDKACKKEFRTRISGLDQAVLYEQLGILHYQLEPRACSRKAIKQFLRIAIENTNATRKKPYDAFQLLHAMLQEDLDEAKTDEEREKINLECQFIKKCMGYFNTPGHYLQQIPNCEERLSSQVSLLEKQRKYSDAYSELYTGCYSGVLCVQEHVKHLLELAGKAAKERESSEPDGALLVYNAVFKLLLNKRGQCSNENSCNGATNHTTAASITAACKTAASASAASTTAASTTAASTSDAVVPHNNFVLLVDDGDCSVVERLQCVLEQCNFSVYILSELGYNDIRLGVNIVSEPIEAILHADVVLGYAPQMLGCSKHWLHTAVANIMQKKSKDRLILISDESTNYPCEFAAISTVTIPALSSESENCERVKAEINLSPHDVMPVLLSAIVEKIFPDCILNQKPRKDRCTQLDTLKTGC